MADCRVFLQYCVAGKDFNTELALESVLACVGQPLMTLQRALTYERFSAVALPSILSWIVRFLVNFDRIPVDRLEWADGALELFPEFPGDVSLLDVLPHVVQVNTAVATQITNVVDNLKENISVTVD